MNDHTFYYFVDRWLCEDQHTIEKHNCHQISFYSIHNEWNYEDLLEQCADDFHSNHDGWDYRDWPNNSMIFHLFDRDMTYVGKFDVYLEFTPTFFVSRL